MNQPKFLITGATGFLGRHIIDALDRILPGSQPIAVVRSRKQWEQLCVQYRHAPIPTVEGRLTPTTEWENDPQLENLAGIFHLAGEVKHSRKDTDSMWSTNVEGTLSMVRLAAAKKCRMIFVSSSGTVSCSTNSGNAKDETAPFCEETVGNWPYYASKIAAEKAAVKLAKSLGVELVILRPPVLLGPGDHRFRSTSNVIRLLRKRLPFLLDGGMHFVDIRDASDAFVNAMTHGNPQPVYHLRGTACSLDSFFRQCAFEADLKPSWLKLPGRTMWVLANLNAALGSKVAILPDPVVVEMAAHYWDVLSTHAEKDLGFKSRPAPETLSDTIAWLRQYHPQLNPTAPVSRHVLQHH